MPTQPIKIVTAAEMKSLDRRATAEFGIPSLLLMENAARGLVDRIEAVYGPLRQKKFVILAGRGNNGGDGIAAARHLRSRGAEVIIYLLSPVEKVGGDAKTSLDIWTRSGGALAVVGAFTRRRLADDLSRADLAIDALLGTGLSQPVKGEYAKAVEQINRSGKTVVSVDIPSGISADTGEMLGTAVKADLTLTMALPKRGHFVQAGLERRGKLQVVDLGFPPALIESAGIQVELITAAMLEGLPPRRAKGIHKGTLGHLLVVAGSVGKRGAAQMTGLAAMRSGTGLVTIAMPRSLDAGFTSLMEAMSLPLPETAEGTLALAAEKPLLEAMEGKNAAAIGPGLSQNAETQRLVRTLIAEAGLPMVIDADGLNAIAADLSVLKKKRGPLILTPHPGEMGRLLGKRPDAVQKDRFNIAADFAEKWDVFIVLKGAHTIIAGPDRSLWVNQTGNPGMATAGIGDALTGMIGGFLAQGLGPKEAATLGIYLHGLAGDLAAAERGEAGLITSDLIGKIPEAILNKRRGVGHGAPGGKI